MWNVFNFDGALLIATSNYCKAQEVYLSNSGSKMVYDDRCVFRNHPRYVCF